MFWIGLIIGLLVWQGLSTVIALLGKETDEKFLMILCGVWNLPIACYVKIKNFIRKQYIKRKYVLITFMKGKEQYYTRKLLKIKYLDRVNLSNKKEFWVKVEVLNKSQRFGNFSILKEKEISTYRRFLREG